MDPYCFLKWDEEQLPPPEFNPRPCKYMTIQHPKVRPHLSTLYLQAQICLLQDLSEPIFNEGILQEKDVLPFVQRPCQPFFHEVRIV